MALPTSTPACLSFASSVRLTCAPLPAASTRRCCSSRSAWVAGVPRPGPARCVPSPRFPAGGILARTRRAPRRASLRRALYFLRQYLGNEVIVSRGEEEISRCEGLLWCDALAFEERLAADDAAAALDLYRGELPPASTWRERRVSSAGSRGAGAAKALEPRTPPGHSPRRPPHPMRRRGAPGRPLDSPRTTSRRWSAC